MTAVECGVTHAETVPSATGKMAAPEWLEHNTYFYGPPLKPRRTRRFRNIDRFLKPEELTTTKQCRARISVPSGAPEYDVIFTCNLLKGHAEPSLDGPEYTNEHTEVGRVRNKDGIVRTYKFTWCELPPEVWRAASSAKPTREDPEVFDQAEAKYYRG